MRNIIYLILPLLAVSCNKEVEIDLPVHEEKLVIGSLFTGDQKIKAMITKSQPANDTNYVVDEFLHVFLEWENGREQMRRKDDYSYISLNPAEEGVEYRIVTESKSYGIVSAKDWIPSNIPFSIIQYTPTERVDVEGENMSGITIRFNDPPESVNYYEVRLKAKRAYRGDVYYENLESKDIAVKNEGLANEMYDKDGLIFSDELFDGQTKTLSFTFFNYIGDDLNKLLKAEVQLRNVSEDYYRYKKKLYLHLENQEGDIWDGTGNPVEAYSNIENGYGIFAGYSETVQPVDLDN